MIEVAFYRGKGMWEDRAIRAWTFSPYSHCELHFGAGICFSALPGTGTRWATLDLNTGDWDRVSVPSAGGWETKISEFCSEEAGCGYDWRGIFCTQVLPLGWESATKWFCSEICAAALQRASILGGATPAKFNPGSLARRLRDL